MVVDPSVIRVVVHPSLIPLVITLNLNRVVVTFNLNRVVVDPSLIQVVVHPSLIRVVGPLSRIRVVVDPSLVVFAHSLVGLGPSHTRSRAHLEAVAADSDDLSTFYTPLPMLTPASSVPRALYFEVKQTMHTR